MNIYKFGGASVNSAQAVENMAAIVRRHSGSPLVVVVSAMGKTTNLLERLVPGVNPPDQQAALFSQLADYHHSIAEQLFRRRLLQVPSFFPPINDGTGACL